MASESSSNDFVSTRILGIRVDAVDREQTLSLVRQYLAEGRRRQIVTINPEMLMMARHDSALQGAVQEAGLVVADGAGLLLAARLLGLPLRERITGVDLVPDLARLASEAESSVFFLGARPGVALRCAQALRDQVPGLQVGGTHAGSPSAAEELDICRRIVESGATVLLVAYGVPEEEKWIARNLPRLPVRIAVGVGGAFDFIAGEVPRAPRWMRNVGLEWLYRLYREPWRWRRMSVLPRFLLLVLAQAVRARLT